VAAVAATLAGLNVPTRAGDKGGKDRPQGKWTVTSAIERGRPSEEAAQSMVFEFKGDEFTLSMLGKSMKGSFKADTGKSPKQFAMQLEGKAETLLGIYKIDNDVLTLCFSGKPGERPTKFESPAGSANVLVVLKRGEAKLTADQQKALAEKAEKMTSQNNLRQIAIAMLNYHDAYRGFPAHAIYSQDGKPLLSWRVAILPFVEEAQLYREFKLDEPWDSAHNKKLLARMPKLYAPVRAKTKEPHSTFYQVFVGPGAAFEGKKGLRIPGDFPDGTSNTLLAVEAGQAVPWTKPADLTYDAQKDLPALGGEFKDGFHIALVDGSSRWIRRGFDVPTFRLLITRNDGQPLDWQKLER
jgi:uncharacterized protein (TIGR03067 family)